MNVLIAGDEILSYIPQRGIIVMVDKFYGIEDKVSISGLTISADNIFCEANQFQECGLIEHIAQSAALRVGYLCKSQGLDIPIGFIGSVSKFKLHLLPNIGDEIVTYVTVEHEVFNITLISAVSKIGSEVIADCQMKIFLQD